MPDLACNLPGRGLWLMPHRDIVERAVAKRLFSRAARRPVVVPAGMFTVTAVASKSVVAVAVSAAKFTVAVPAAVVVCPV